MQGLGVRSRVAANHAQKVLVVLVLVLKHERDKRSTKEMLFFRNIS